MTNLDSILKSEDITLLTDICIIKAVVFPVVMYGCENWTIKKGECWRIDAFELCWRRLLKVPWTARKPNQSILKEINPKYSLKGLMLKLQYFGHLIQSADSLAKTLMLGNTEGRRRGVDRMGWLDSITDSVDMNLGKLQEMVKGKEAWHAAVHPWGHSHTRLSNWTAARISQLLITYSAVTGHSYLLPGWVPYFHPYPPSLYSQLSSQSSPLKTSVRLIMLLFCSSSVFTFHTERKPEYF